MSETNNCKHCKCYEHCTCDNKPRGILRKSEASNSNHCEPHKEQTTSDAIYSLIKELTDILSSDN